jgi:hypothetical protein
MMPLNGDKIRPRLSVRAGNKTFSWLFDTGAAVTCMNKESFDLALTAKVVLTYLKTTKLLQNVILDFKLVHKRKEIYTPSECDSRIK